MVKRPDGMNAFEFSVLSGLRAAQLSLGCTPRVIRSAKVAVTAQHEVAERKVVRSVNIDVSAPDPAEQG
jgi:DNA-directed RNA polymerase subunit K/omega